MILTSLIYNPFIENICTNYFIPNCHIYIYIQQQLLKSCYMKNFLRKLSHTSYFTTLSFSPTYPNNMIHIHPDTLCPNNKKLPCTFMHSSSNRIIFVFSPQDRDVSHPSIAEYNPHSSDNISLKLSRLPAEFRACRTHSVHNTLGCSSNTHLYPSA